MSTSKIPCSLADCPGHEPGLPFYVTLRHYAPHEVTHKALLGPYERHGQAELNIPKAKLFLQNASMFSAGVEVVVCQSRSVCERTMFSASGQLMD